jgi:hypothetical protein
MAPLLNPNQISDLITDNDSDKPLCNVAAMEDEAYCEEVLLEQHLWSLSEYTAWSSAKAALSLDSASTSEDDDVQSGPDPATKITVDIALSPSAVCSTHAYNGPKRKNDSEAPHINDGSTPFSVFTYFTETVTLLVVETTRY